MIESGLAHCPPTTVSVEPSTATTDTAALLQACRALLVPLAQLAVARGVQYSEIDELLRGAFVDAALAVHPEVAAHRAVSRVSTATGLHRREVSRLIQSEPVAAIKRSPATQVFTRWVSDPAWRHNGAPLASLPRQGAQLSFEALAQSVTKDVHPRSLLEELCRLGLARLDETADRVELLRDRFAPVGDEARMLGFVGGNVGDHLRASVANVLASAPPHLEQALFADELSSESVQRLQPLVREHWQQLMRTLAPSVQQLIDDDQAKARVQDQRIRVGLYAYTEVMDDVMSKSLTPTTPKKQAIPKKAAPARRRPS